MESDEQPDQRPIEWVMDGCASDGLVGDVQNRPAATISRSASIFFLFLVAKEYWYSQSQQLKTD